MLETICVINNTRNSRFAKLISVFFQIQIVESDQKEENLRNSPPKFNIEADAAADVDEEATEATVDPLGVLASDDLTDESDEEDSEASSASQAATKLATSDAYIKESDTPREMVSLVDKCDQDDVGASAGTQQQPPQQQQQPQQTTSGKSKSKFKKLFFKNKSKVEKEPVC